MPNKYKQIFFDFDNTLWDFTYNSKESLKDLYNKYKLYELFENFDSFYDIYEKNNNKLWEQYRKGNISKESLTSQRFIFVSEKFSYYNQIDPIQLNSDYLTLSTKKTKVIENAKKLLNYLKEKYIINIITDGFFEVQMVKLSTSKLSSFISNVITAEEVGHLKPNKELFTFALESCKAKKEESIMIGDNYTTDILGAYYAGIDQIFFNRMNIKNLKIKPTYTVNSLIEIMKIL